MEPKEINNEEYVVFGGGNKSVLVCTSPGYGKTSLSKTLQQHLYEHEGYKIIILTDPKRNFEEAFMSMPADNKKQLALIKRDNRQHLIKAYPIEIRHPITIAKRSEGKDEGVPETKKPPIKFYTIPLKSLTGEEIKFLNESEDENDNNFKLINNTLNTLNDEEGLIDFMQKIAKAVDRKQEKKNNQPRRDAENFYLPIPEGTATNLGTVITLFKPFGRHQFLSKAKTDYNLNMKKILQEQETITIFSERYIVEEKVRDFCIYWLLSQIMRAAKEIGQPVLVVLPEIRMILPRESPERAGHKSVFANHFKRFLTTMRTENVSVFSETQVLSDVDTEVASSFVIRILGYNNAPADMKYMKETSTADKSLIDFIKSAQRGQFKIVGQEYLESFRAFFPTCKIKWEGENFDREYAKTYPEQLRDNSKDIKKYKETIVEHAQDWKQRLEARDYVEAEEKKKHEALQTKVKRLETEKEGLQEEKKTQKSLEAEKKEAVALGYLEEKKLSYSEIIKAMKEEHDLTISKNTLIKLNRERLAQQQEEEEIIKEEPIIQEKKPAKKKPAVVEQEKEKSYEITLFED